MRKKNRQRKESYLPLYIPFLILSLTQISTRRNMRFVLQDAKNGLFLRINSECPEQSLTFHIKACEVGEGWWGKWWKICPWKTHLRSCLPKGSGDQTWRCIDCTRRSVSIWWASVSVEYRPLKWVHLDGNCNANQTVGLSASQRSTRRLVLNVYKQNWKVIITKQVLQNMLRSRQPVSASSTIV